MPELLFHGDAVVVTGAGRNMGRAHALELAGRGARVVVNDVDADLAHAVAEEIRGLGGEAVPNTASVATPEGGASLTADAMTQWGRLDALVHNATTTRHLPFDEMTPEDIDGVIDVKLRGAFFSFQPAYKAMKATGGGRLVAVTSMSGLLGSVNQANYAAANAGLVGLVRALAYEGAGHGIKANLLNPGAMNARAEQYRDQIAGTTDVYERLTPDRVSPMVTVLVHDSCPCTGQILSAWAGAFALATVTFNDGWASTDGRPTAEDVVAHWPQIVDQTTASDPQADAFTYAGRNFERLFGR